MKKLKIFLPSIALIVVLAFSITIGVYAASEVSFTVSSSISFKSPDIGAIINCYINEKDETKEHIWNNVNEDGTIRGDGVEGYTESWNLNDETLAFTGTSEAGKSTLTLNFEIINKTTLPIYAYIADSTGVIVTKAKSFTGTKGTENLITASAGSVVSVAESTTDNGTTATSMLTITFTLNKNVIRGEQVDIASLGWQVQLSKFNPTVS